MLCLAKPHLKPDFVCEGLVNGQPVKRIQLDMGCSRTVVHKQYIVLAAIQEKTATIWNVNSQPTHYPLAKTTLKVDNEVYKLKVNIALNLLEDVLLGRDTAIYTHITCRLPQSN